MITTTTIPRRAGSERVGGVGGASVCGLHGSKIWK
jgi:hypothetical protein